MYIAVTPIPEDGRRWLTGALAQKINLFFHHFYKAGRHHTCSPAGTVPGGLLCLTLLLCSVSVGMKPASGQQGRGALLL